MKPSDFQSIVIVHCSRYPELQVEDLYKLTHQAALGSEHAVDDITTARQWLVRELDQLPESSVELLFEEISPDKSIVRVHLKPYFEAGGDLEDLRNHLAESGVELSRRAFYAAERFIRFQVEREIALRAWGDAGEFRRIVSQDRAVQRALSLLERSASTSDLLQLARDPGLSDWVPIQETQEELVDPTIAGGL